MNKSVICVMALLIMQMFNVAAADEPKRYSNREIDAQLYAASMRVDNQEIKPLKIQGKPLRDAMSALMAIGYSCGMEVHSSWDNQTKENFMHCEKQTQEEFCREVSVRFSVKGIPPQQSTAELEQQLDAAKAFFPITLCAFPDRISQAYLAHHKEAEVKLNELAKSYPLVSATGKEALKTMLAAGYRCGISYDETKTPNMSCTYPYSKIEYCYGANIQMEMTWQQPSGDRADLLRQLDAAVVKKVESSCLITNLKPKSDYSL